MSVAELQKVLIEKVENTEDELLLRKAIDIINSAKPRPEINQVYKEIADQYKNTLTKLAQ